MPFLPVVRLLMVVMSFAALPVPAAEPDAGGPKAAMKAFYQALEAGDAVTIRASFDTKTNAERELADAVAADISADKFPTAQDAQRMLQQRLQAVLFNALQKNPPTTRPAATAPAKP